MYGKYALSERAYTLSERMYERMDAMGMSSKQLACASGASMTAINQYLAAKVQPGCFVLRDIARALRCSSDWLMGGEMDGRDTR